MGEPINTQPITLKEERGNRANLLSTAVPDSLETERGVGEGGRRSEQHISAISDGFLLVFIWTTNK